MVRLKKAAMSETVQMRFNFAIVMMINERNGRSVVEKYELIRNGLGTSAGYT